jgi:glycosyltransferase involved in cell wall biosynthesis
MNRMQSSRFRSPTLENRPPELGNARISIALCTYNGEAYLKQQLDSIAAQTVQPIELVVCDDRSTDSTIPILEDFRRTAKFPVRIHRNEEQLRTTRNFEKALRLCVGDFIALSDQDDLWRPEKLEKLVGLLKADPTAGGVFSDAILIDSDSQPTGHLLFEKHRFSKTRQLAFGHDPVSILLKHDVITGATLIVRPSILETFNQMPPNWLHDGWLAWMFAINDRKVLICDEPMTLYRMHASQQVGVNAITSAARWRAARDAESARYKSTAMQFEAILDYVERLPSKQALASIIRGKIAHQELRANMPRNRIKRAIAVVKHLSGYGRFSQGALSIMKDLK